MSNLPSIGIAEFKLMIRDGVQRWNEWRPNNYHYKIDLRGADLRGCVLNHIDLSLCDLSESDLRGAKFRESNLLTTKFRNAELQDADFSIASLTGTDFTDSRLQRAGFSRADMYGTKFVRADLSDANFISASLVRTDMSDAILDGSRVWAASVWDLVGTPASQRSLRVTPLSEPSITVDNLELAQFVRLLLTSHKLRDVIDTMTSRTVLILGRFSPEQKLVLEAIAQCLRKHDYIPILFDWTPPVSRNMTETVSILAHLARFVVADITDPRSVPQELQNIVPSVPSVPILPLISADSHAYGMFDDFRDYRNVLEPVIYFSTEHLIEDLHSHAVRSAERLAEEIVERRGRRQREK